ncbi:MAG: hypothetical protein KGL57_03440 [Burkholderiales bacterium]|nr:hypothetical protein [Burkholderiales bacterium]
MTDEKNRVAPSPIKATKQDANWLTSFFALMWWVFLFISIYAISWVANGTFNPVYWGGISTYLTTSAFTLLLWGGAVYLDSQGVLQLEGIITTHFNINEYVETNKTALDSIISHYGYVATAGLFLAVTLYSIRPLIKLQSALGGFILAPLSLLSFFLYALFLLRLARKFTASKNAIFFMVVMLSVAVVDAQAIQMMIKGVPVADAAKP